MKVRLLHPLRLGLLIGALIGMPQSAQGIDAASDDSRRSPHHPQLARAEEAGFRPWSPNPRSLMPRGLSHPAPAQAWVRRADPQAGPQRPILVVIESDGAPWRYGGRVPPEDPTPRNPIGLQMAMAAPADMQVLYLARPCQFLRKPLARYSACADSQWWTDKRFSPEVVDAYVAGIDSFLTDTQSLDPHKHAQPAPTGEMPPEAAPPATLPHLILAGFSGGGTLALRVASQWPQFLSSARALCLISLAAPLDLHAWTAHHRLRPVHGAVPDAVPGAPLGATHGAAHRDEDFSLLAEGLEGVRAHFAFGTSDRIVPLQSAGRFATHPAWQHALHHYPGLGHDDSWLKVWPTLLSKAC